MVSSCRSGVVCLHNINGSSDDHHHQKRSSSSVILQMQQQNIIKCGPHQDQVIDQVPAHDHHHHQVQMQVQVQIPLKCPRCESSNTKFCYYNNYSLSQPRYFCKSCRRYWTKGGSLRNVPVGGGCRKNKLHCKTTSTTTSNYSSYINTNSKIIKSTQLPYQQHQQLGVVLSPPRPAHPDPDHLVGIVVFQPPPPPSCLIIPSSSSSSSSSVLLNSSYNDHIDQYSTMMMISPPHAQQQQQLTHDLLGMNSTIIRPNHNQTGRSLRDNNIDQINAADHHVADHIDDQILMDGTTTTTRRNNIISTAGHGFPRMDLSLFGLSANSSVHGDPDHHHHHHHHHHHAPDHMGQIGRSTINHEDQQVSINGGLENINYGGDHDHQLIMQGNIGTLAMENNINGAFRGGTTSSDDDSSMMNRTKDLDHAGTAAHGRMWGAHDDDDDEWGSGGSESGKDQAAGNKVVDNKQQQQQQQQQDQYYWNTMGPWHAMLNSYAAAGPASSLTPLM